MSSHDFKGLHDKEFESLCADLLGVSMSIRTEIGVTERSSSTATSILD
jgi:hypothetical protein